MKNLKNELLKLGQSWNVSGEHDDTEFTGRLFISDTDLDEFALKHDLRRADGDEVIEKVCDCRIIYDYKGRNQNRQFSDQEIIFNS